MNSAVNEIVVNLQEQVLVYRRLLELSQIQVAALLNQDVHTVHSVLQEIELAMLDRSKVEQHRSLVLDRICAETGLAIGEITASRLAALAEPSIAEAITSCSNELHDLIRELDAVVDKSRALLEQELQVIDSVVQSITVVNEPFTYERSGDTSERARRKLLDMQV